MRNTYKYETSQFELHTTLAFWDGIREALNEAINNLLWDYNERREFFLDPRTMKLYVYRPSGTDYLRVFIEDKYAENLRFGTDVKITKQQLKIVKDMEKIYGCLPQGFYPFLEKTYTMRDFKPAMYGYNFDIDLTTGAYMLTYQVTDDYPDEIVKRVERMAKVIMDKIQTEFEKEIIPSECVLDACIIVPAGLQNLIRDRNIKDIPPVRLQVEITYEEYIEVMTEKL